MRWIRCIIYEDVWCWWADGEEWNEDGCGETIKCGKYLQRSAEAGWSEWRVNCWIIHDRCIHCNWQLETRERGAVSMCHQNCSYFGNMWTFNFFFENGKFIHTVMQCRLLTSECPSWFWKSQIYCHDQEWRDHSPRGRVSSQCHGSHDMSRAVTQGEGGWAVIGDTGDGAGLHLARSRNWDTADNHRPPGLLWPLPVHGGTVAVLTWTWNETNAHVVYSQQSSINYGVEGLRSSSSHLLILIGLIFNDWCLVHEAQCSVVSVVSSSICCARWVMVRTQLF